MSNIHKLIPHSAKAIADTIARIKKGSDVNTVVIQFDDVGHVDIAKSMQSYTGSARSRPHTEAELKLLFGGGQLALFPDKFTQAELTALTDRAHDDFKQNVCEKYAGGAYLCQAPISRKSRRTSLYQ